MEEAIALALQPASFYAVFWLPPGRHIEPGGNDAALEAAIGPLVHDLSGTRYMQVLTQYSTSGSTPVQNGPITDQLAYAGVWVDTTPYPHAGTTQDPLRPGDYGDSVKRAMAANGWPAGLDRLYLVYTAGQTEVCGLASLPSGGHAPNEEITPQDCTFPVSDLNQCTAHSSFLQGGQPVAYAIIPSPADQDHCAAHAGLPQDPNNDIPLDTVLGDAAMLIAAMITDPLDTGWYTGLLASGELACFGEDSFGDLHINGHAYGVFTLYSNAQHDCELGTALAITVSVKAKTVKPGQKETVRVQTAAGAQVTVEVLYPGGASTSRQGQADGAGMYQVSLRVPRSRGTARLTIVASTGDGGKGVASSSFRIH